ncbi:MAG: class I SAM-dependent methyltransferase [Actinomycetes bacterium]
MNDAGDGDSTPGVAPTRWATVHGEDHSRWYVDRFRRMAAEGADLEGEARLLDAVVGRGSRILDGGCGGGRVGAALSARGHHVVGVDADPLLIEAAREDHPQVRWLVMDLTALDPGELRLSEDGAFDAAIVPGNVLPYAAEGTQGQILRQLGGVVRSDGVVVVGFGAGRGYWVDEWEPDVASSGLVEEQRFATWDLRPWRRDSDFLVSVLRVQ